MENEYIKTVEKIKMNIINWNVEDESPPKYLYKIVSSRNDIRIFVTPDFETVYVVTGEIGEFEEPDFEVTEDEVDPERPYGPEYSYYEMYRIVHTVEYDKYISALKNLEREMLSYKKLIQEVK